MKSLEDRVKMDVDQFVGLLDEMLGGHMVICLERERDRYRYVENQIQLSLGCKHLKNIQVCEHTTTL